MIKRHINRRNFIISSGLGLTGLGLSVPVLSMSQANATLSSRDFPMENEDSVLNYHLMHPGGPSAPGDPNAVFFSGWHLPFTLYPSPPMEG